MGVRIKDGASRSDQTHLSERQPYEGALDVPWSAAPLGLLRFPEVKRRTGLSRSTIWRLERRGEFPRHCRISSGAVAWLESEVSEWMRDAGRRRDRPTSEE